MTGAIIRIVAVLVVLGVIAFTLWKIVDVQSRREDK